jgi:hypothetical protein
MLPAKYRAQNSQFPESNTSSTIAKCYKLCSTFLARFQFPAGDATPKLAPLTAARRGGIFPPMSHEGRQQQEHSGVLRVIIEQDAGFTAWLSGQFAQIFQRLDRIEAKQEKLMADLDQALADIADEKTAIAGVATLIGTLRQQVADALSGATLPPAVQAKVDAVFAGLEDNKTALASALTTQPSGAPVIPVVTPPAPATPPANPAAGL